MTVAIRIENLSKRYTLGLTHAGSLRELANGFASRLFGKRRSATDRPLDDESVRLSKGEFWALRDVNFDIQQGDVVGVIGRNGAGKSTLLKILSRITSPTTGLIELTGRVASLLEVGTGFHPELTGRENVYLNGAILGMTSAEVGKQFDQIVGFSGVEKFIDTPVKRYSSGMKVRLGFAVAAHLQPEILIVDEVLAVGDLEFQRKCLGKMNDVAESGRTVIFVSHNMSAVSQLCRSGVVLDGGMTIGISPVETAIETYMGLGNESNKGGVFEANTDSTEPQIKRIGVASENQSMSVVRHDHEHQIEFTISNPEKTRNLRLSIAVCDSLQRKVFTAVTELTTDPYQISELTVAKRFLLPGTYSIIAGILDPNLNLLDHLRFVCPYAIENVGDELFSVGNGDYGVVFGNCQWNTKLSSLTKNQ